MSVPEDVYLGESAHLDAFWPDRAADDFTWELGPLKERLPEFRVRCVSPQEQDDGWVYASLGAWEATADTGAGCEFVVHSPVESALHVELLAMVVNFHADPAYVPLDVGRVVDIGRPWLPGSNLTHLLVSLPYPWGPELECCTLPGLHIRYLWLTPITASEAVFVHGHGAEALEQRLEAAAVNSLAASRASVV